MFKKILESSLLNIGLIIAIVAVIVVPLSGILAVTYLLSLATPLVIFCAVIAYSLWTGKTTQKELTALLVGIFAGMYLCNQLTELKNRPVAVAKTECPASCQCGPECKCPHPCQCGVEK